MTLKWPGMFAFIHAVNWGFKIHLIPTRWLRGRIIKGYYLFIRWRKRRHEYQ